MIVKANIEDNRKFTIQPSAQLVVLCLFTIWKIWQKDFGIRVYKVQLMQELKEFHKQNYVLRQGSFLAKKNKIVEFRAMDKIPLH